MEISNQNLANQVIATLNTLNENITSLSESLKNVRIGGEKHERANEDFKQIKGETKETGGPVE